MQALVKTSCRLSFAADIMHWKGPSPFFFAPIPSAHTETLRQAGRIASYGWGVIPVEATIGRTVFRTSLFPRGDGYLLPLKMAARREANLTAGDHVEVDMTVLARPFAEP